MFCVVCMLIFYYVNHLFFWVEAWNEGGAQTKIKKDRGCVYQ
jgi:hypothetical protein